MPLSMPLNVRHCVLCLFASALLLLLCETPLFALKIPMTKDQLEKESALIAVGKVRSFLTGDRVGKDGSKTRDVFLSVEVESVEKGEAAAKPGDIIEVYCWKPVKPGPDGYFWEQGNDFVPGEGGRARFFLEQRAENRWRSHWPNGIEALDDVPPLTIEREPADVQSADATAAIPTATSGKLWLTIGAVALVVACPTAWWAARRLRQSSTA